MSELNFSGEPISTSHGYIPPIYPDIPLTTQPSSKDPEETVFENWAPVPLCIPGLECLAMLDQLLVYQKIEFSDVGELTRNEYDIKNSTGQIIFTAEEESSSRDRKYVGHRVRTFDMPLRDNTGKEVVHLYRESHCGGWCCPCSLQRIEVFSPPGTLVGKVLEEWSFWKPNYRVENGQEDSLFRMIGPICPNPCCNYGDFLIFAADGVQIGKIARQYSHNIAADPIEITFPMDLDATMKAVLLGALFLIDFMYFQTERQSTNLD